MLGPMAGVGARDWDCVTCYKQKTKEFISLHFAARKLNEKLPVQPSGHHPKLLSDLERRAAVPHESRESNDCRRVRECYQITIIEGIKKR